MDKAAELSHCAFYERPPAFAESERPRPRHAAKAQGRVGQTCYGKAGSRAFLTLMAKETFNGGLVAAGLAFGGDRSGAVVAHVPEGHGQAEVAHGSLMPLCGLIRRAAN
jgi:hypothetical protein